VADDTIRTNIINYVNYTETRTTWRMIPSGLTVHQQGYIYLIN
jgi:hypothetical protein